MTAHPFLDEWTFFRAGADPEPVTLPHDAMRDEPRSADASTGNHGGYFPGGRYRYSRSWTAPADVSEHRTSLFFEGVYETCRVLLDGVDVGGCDDGYREFAVELTGAVRPGETHRIEVVVDDSTTPNSRWYSGAGIYRRVWLEQVPETHIRCDGVRFRTRSLDGPAVADVAVTVEGAEDRALEVVAELVAAEGGVGVGARAAVSADGRAQLVLEVPNPRLWSHDSPQLSTLRVRLLDGDVVVDERVTRVGLRTIAVDAQHGLRINGKRVLLKGACVHHDSGILGAATFRAAEFRRIRILKENGFNAVRSSHNPLSRDMLDACDRYGMYVLDELTDVWYDPKTAHDASSRFETGWMDDARSLIAKDRNHPSVIMYSIGNEVAETATPRGVETTRSLHTFFREQDPDRPTTVAVNFLLNVMASFGRSPFDGAEPTPKPEKEAKPQSAVTSTAANVIANRIGSIMQLVARLPRADRFSRDALAAVDVAGYNYAWGRYRGDARRHPDRVVLGTESLPGDIARIWPIVEDLPNVIGDFLWTGWDYLGEAGIGTWSYGADSTSAVAKDYPNLLAGCGVIDITGLPGAGSFLARAAWQDLPGPQIAVRPLPRSGEAVRRTAWRSTDAVPSWSWAGCSGRTAEIEVYSDAASIEVLVNGRSLGTQRAGRGHGFLARFTTPYEPGEITAVASTGGVERGRTTLRSAGVPRLRLVPEAPAADGDEHDLAFIRIELADEEGIIEMTAQDVVTLEVSGAGSLVGFGNAAPATEEGFGTAAHSTWFGSALAVVRLGPNPGDVEIAARSEHHGNASVQLRALRSDPASALSSPDRQSTD